MSSEWTPPISLAFSLLSLNSHPPTRDCFSHTRLIPGLTLAQLCCVICMCHAHPCFNAFFTHPPAKSAFSWSGQAHSTPSTLERVLTSPIPQISLSGEIC